MNENLLRAAIYSFVLLAAFGTLVASRAWENPGELWLNLFAEALGVAFTVLIVEQVIRLAERRRTKPARYAAYTSAQMIYGRFRGLWWEMIQAAFDPARDGAIVASEGITLLDGRLGEIVAHLNLESEPKVVPKRTWRIYLRQKVDECELRIDRCLQRYAAFMEPDLIESLHRLERSHLLLIAKNLDVQTKPGTPNHFAIGPTLGWGRRGSSEDFVSAMKALENLLVHARPEFSGMKGVVDVIDTEGQTEIRHLRDIVARHGMSNDHNTPKRSDPIPR